MAHNFMAFAEPKGFIKVLQLLFVIISFSCICSFSGTASYKVVYNSSDSAASVHISYPFEISANNIVYKLNDTIKPTLRYINFASNSQFTVFVGVFSFFYCIAAMLFYVFLNDFLYLDPKIRKTDFVIEAVLSFLFFAGAIAWTDVVVKLKGYIDEGFCKDLSSFNLKCGITNNIAFSTAYVGIIASFTSFALMLSGLWFLWKETSWFNKPVGDQYQPENTPRGDQTYY